MKPRLAVSLSILSLIVLASAKPAHGEVRAVLDPDGRFLATHVASRGNSEGAIWHTSGNAASAAHVLNPEGDLRGDGRPDIAVSPLTHLPRAVWSRREGSDFDIATSAFDGHSWSAPAFIHVSEDADDLDPRITFRSDGVAVVTWWQNGPTPTVRMAYMAPDGRWSEAGVISPPGVKARTPEVRQEGSLTIVAYRMPRRIGIATFTIIVPVFADGPTPFPRDGNGPNPDDKHQ